jgi:ubiquinone/menaquinone biosynthesis C-methylase UbiE
MTFASIAEHYDTHLAEHYTWLFGGLPQRAAENKKAFLELGLGGKQGARALDLGAGSGFQSIPLAELGYAVTSVDLSRKLLDELAANAKGLPITIKHEDFLRTLAASEPGLELCVCMGDTLTHLSSFGDVQRVFREVHRVLAPGGVFVTLEFFRPSRGVTRLFHETYAKRVLPTVGGLISGDPGAYAYLAKSMGAFLSRDEYSLMLREAGFTNVRGEDQLLGISAIVTGSR